MTTRSLLLNVLVALIWLLLQPAPSIAGLLFGFAIGFGLLALFRPVLDSGDYVRRVLAGIWFGVVFTREFLLACLQLVRLILFVPSERLRPAFLIFDISDLSRVEILLLSHVVTLTPGTSTVDISADFKRLYLHVLDCPDPEAVRAEIERTLKRGILAFTR